MAEPLSFGGVNNLNVSPELMQQFVFWLLFVFAILVLIGIVAFIVYIAKHNLRLEIWQKLGNGFIDVKTYKARKVNIAGVCEYRLLFQPDSTAIKAEDETSMIYKTGKVNTIKIYKRNDQEYDFIGFDGGDSKFKPIPQSALLWGQMKNKQTREMFMNNKLQQIMQIVIPFVMMAIFLVAVILILDHMKNFESNIMNQASSVLAQAKQSTIEAVK